MLIYSNGCSHTQGHCTEKTYDDVLAKFFFDASDLNKVFIRKSSKEHFSKYNELMDSVQENINENFIYKNSLSGKSNNLIFMETYQFVTECIKRNIKIDYIIVQTSGPNRRYHTTDWGAYHEVNPHDNIDLGLKFEPWGTIETLQWVYLLQKLFLEQKVPYVFVPYMELDEESYNLSPYIDLIDWSKFTTNPLIGHRNDFRERGTFTCDEAGHPNANGYYHLAKLCLNILEPNMTLDDMPRFYNNDEIIYAEPQDWRLDFISEFASELGDGEPSTVQRLMKLFKKDLE